MVRAQLTSTITMSSRDRSETITRGFAAGLAGPSRVARRAADPVVVMDAPRPCRSTVLRFGPGRGRPGCRAPIGWARALELNLGQGRIHPLAAGDGHLLRGEPLLGVTLARKVSSARDRLRRGSVLATSRQGVTGCYRP